MLNLLISIIGFTFGKVIETENAMRNFELLTIITEIEKNKLNSSKIKKLEKENKIGDYLICFHNEHHFKEEEKIEQIIKKEILEKIEEKFSNLQKNIEEKIEKLQKMEEKFEIMHKLEEKIGNMQNKIEESMKKTIESFKEDIIKMGLDKPKFQ